jgi:voltage-gated potassium channel
MQARQRRAAATLERRLLRIVLTFAVIIAFGGVGYAVIEGWSLLDAFYMAVITVTTVGFAEVYPLSRMGKLFTLVLILLGVGGITYAFSALTNYVIAGELGGFLEARRMKQRLAALKDHYVVCGFGRVGQQVCDELVREGRALVVIDDRQDARLRATERGFPVVYGNAGNDQILLEAGIERARGLVAAAGDDAENVLIALSARALNPSLQIVARANAGDTEAKLFRAGANRVILPHRLGGRRMAQIFLRPDVVDFLDFVMHDESLQLFLENMTVRSGCPLDGRTVGEARIRETVGANILGIKRGDGIIVSPELSTRLAPDDVLVALGTREQLAALARLVRLAD